MPRPSRTGKVKPPMSPVVPSSPSQRVVLDWKGYFVEFCRVHGEPVEYRNSLLFRDGWLYSSTSYEGPETHPPLKSDELDELVVQYWVIRRSNCDRLLLKLLNDRDNLRRIENSHSLPLQQSVLVDDQGKKRRAYQKVDSSGLDQRIEWVRADLEECLVRLREIETYRKERSA